MLPPLRLIPEFALSVANISLQDITGNTTDMMLRAAVAAVRAAADAYTRVTVLGLLRGFGLRGGTFASNNAGTHLTLESVRWVADLAVTGDIKVESGTDIAVARLTLTDKSIGRITAQWAPGGVQEKATIVGHIDGTFFSASMPAP